MKRLVFILSDYILIVDDNENILYLLHEFLIKDGYIIELAGSGVEALKIINNRIPCLVLLDIKMPEMSGLETLAKIRIISPCIPVVVISAYTELHLVQQAIKDNLIKYYIEKPFDLGKLRKLIQEVLQSHSYVQEAL